MRLLKGIAYDPSTAVAKSTASLLAMTAVDTTNLRAAVTIPASGTILIRMRTCLQGATTFPMVLLGALNGATVLGRITPTATLSGTALATTRVALFGEFVCTGLTPGAMNIDAAYGVEILLAATNIQYGGPNNTTTNDAWGAFCFEVWDPDPLPASIFTTTFPSGTIANTTNITAGTITTVTNLTNAPTSGDLTSTMKTSVTTAASAATPIAASVTGAVGSVTGNVGGNVTGSVGSVIGSVGSVTGLTASNLDTTVSSRASPTNITAGTITTVTNLTNAPTVGDLTAAMKASVTTACTASTPSATIAGYIAPANNRLRRLQSAR